jgi:hypothetical protein
MFRARVSPAQRLLLSLALPHGPHEWDRLEVEEFFPIREVLDWTGLGAGQLFTVMRGLWNAWWLDGRLTGGGRTVRVALTVPPRLLWRPSETGHRDASGAMMK